MKKQLKIKQLLTKSGLWVTAAAMLTIPLSTSVFAAKEGVYLNNSVYFSLDGVTLSSGADKGSLRFTLELHNGSGQSIDFNHYGVKIVDSSGVSYPAKLSEKVNARVNPQQVQDFKFISQVPPDAKADQLKVDVFEWNPSKAPYTKDIGALSVSADINNDNPGAKQVVLNMYDLDSTLPTDALAAFELGKSYRVLSDGVWNVYTDLYVENLGSTSFTLPSGLSYNFMDNDGLVYGAQKNNGSADTLLPKQRVKMTVQAAVTSKIDTEQLVLQFSQKSGTEKVVIGSMDLKSSQTINKIGESSMYPYSDQQGVAISTSWAAVNKQSDGLHVQANLTLTNNGTDIVSIPTLAVEFQTASGNVALTSNDNTTRTAYLSPKNSTTFRFSTVLPDSLNTDDLQLVVLEKKSTQSGSSNTTNTTNTTTAAAQASTQQTASIPVMLTSLKGIGSGQESNSYASAQSYTLGTPFVLSSNSLIDSNVDISLMELHMQENEDLGYKTAIAKYKLTNKGTTSLTLPNFQANLINSKGYTYAGVRQSTTAKTTATATATDTAKTTETDTSTATVKTTDTTTTILPNTSNVVSYSFLVPSSETEDQLAMSIFDDNSLDLGSFQVATQKEAESGPISFYPFQVDIKDYSLSALYSSSSYTYKLRLFLDITHQDEVIVDPNFSKLTFDLVDSLGHVLATQTMSFIGDQKLVSGKQDVTFSSSKVDQLESGVTIRMYEQIDTPNGVTKRLVKVLDTP